MLRYARLALVVVFVLLCSAAFADDLTGQNHLLCSAGAVVACADDGNCTNGDPFDLNIPQFVVVDLQAKMLSTTPASGQNRTSPIAHLIRENGNIVLQGFEGGRAFSFLINETTGLVTVAMATDGFSISVFGACTPMPASK
jgi:hypothetical protein